MEIDLVSGGKVGLRVGNPIMVASGFGGYGTELARMGDMSQLGALVTNPVSLRPWSGARSPRLWETPGGFLLNTGNENPGVRNVLRDHAPGWANQAARIIVRISGASPQEHERAARRLEATEGVAALEVAPFLNIDSDQGLGDGLDIIQAMRQATILPLLVAIPFAAPLDLCRWCLEEGSDGLVLCAPPRGAVWDYQGQCMRRGDYYGAGVMSITLDYVARVTATLDVPVLGRGGIGSWEDTLAFLRAGARAVQIGSALMRQPTAPWDILSEMRAWMAAQGIADVTKLWESGTPNQA